MSMNRSQIWIIMLAVLAAETAQSFENTKVLPNGVRSLNVKNVRTAINKKTDKDSHFEPIASPLAKAITFRNVVNGEEGVKATALHAFLNTENFSLDESLGSFSADMQGQINVIAPIFSYGITERLTLAIAAPYYDAKMKASLAFSANARANDFIERLASAGYNQTGSAREASLKLGNAVDELNKKLAQNGYASIHHWNDRGFGDTTIAAKYRLHNGNILSVATTNGVVAPTGKTADPDNLIAIPFGSGSWNTFSQLAADGRINPALFVNSYAKYTYQAHAKRQIRLATETESIEVEKTRTRYKLGDKFESGLSLQYEPNNGFVAGVGVTTFSKFGDKYHQLKSHPDVKAKFQGKTDQWSRHGEIKLGYSSILAYQRGSMPVPFTAGLEFKKHLASRHTVVSDMITADFSMFF